jgi:tryptophan synthase alpha subunit
VASLADAVIVGSAIVARIEAALGRSSFVAEVGEFLAHLRSALG